jgi:hydroxyethylthiazole kinase
VFDPVGCGATTYRTATAQQLTAEIQPTIIRGNASEIRALLRSGQGTKGVDSTQTPEDVIEEARALSLARRCVVSVSGAVDLIVEGNSVTRVANGHSIMSRVTGMGCIATTITAAFQPHRALLISHSCPLHNASNSSTAKATLCRSTA